MFIVNPWIFYFAEICEGLKTTAISITVIALIYVICKWCLWMAGEIRSFWWDKKTKIITAIGIIFMIFAITIPSQKTCYKMIIASQVTAENLDKVEGTIERIADYVADKDE